MVFKDEQHRKFYMTFIEQCHIKDVYHKALIYCLGIDNNTRRNVSRIYDFKSDLVKTECIYDGWQTSSSIKVVRLAFNLYTDGVPTTYDIENVDTRLDECRKYSVSDIFCHSNAHYFVEAVKIRYPEYFTA